MTERINEVMMRLSQVAAESGGALSGISRVEALIGLYVGDNAPSSVPVAASHSDQTNLAQAQQDAFEAGPQSPSPGCSRLGADRCFVGIPGDEVLQTIALSYNFLTRMISMNDFHNFHE